MTRNINVNNKKTNEREGTNMSDRNNTKLNKVEFNKVIRAKEVYANVSNYDDDHKMKNYLLNFIENYKSYVIDRKVLQNDDDLEYLFNLVYKRYYLMQPARKSEEVCDKLYEIIQRFNHLLGLRVERYFKLKEYYSPKMIIETSEIMILNALAVIRICNHLYALHCNGEQFTPEANLLRAIFKYAQ